jgi:NAD(P)-dependent dehydrogenase (short-subunit alcohol dehydrogenase family)
MSDKPIVIVTGVGPGTGSAIVRRFAAEGFRVIALARSPDHIRALEQELPDTHAMICDVSSESEVTNAVANIRKLYGSPNVLVHNAVGGGWGTFLEIEPKLLDRNFQVNVMGLLYLARELAPDMIRAGSGTILVTGNTSAIRGKANFAGFAPTKAAQRILSESIARDLGPRGIHVAYVLIDAVIDVPRMREPLPEAPDEFFIKPSAIADELWHLYGQDRSAWSFLTEIRPFGEKW